MILDFDNIKMNNLGLAVISTVEDSHNPFIEDRTITITLTSNEVLVFKKYMDHLAKMYELSPYGMKSELMPYLESEGYAIEEEWAKVVNIPHLSRAIWSFVE